MKEKKGESSPIYSTDVVKFNHLNIDLLKISAEASAHKKEDPSVINATVGVFLNDYNNLYSFDSVDKSFINLNKEKLKSYLNPSGGKEYLNNIYRYVLNNNEELFNSFYINANWTAGGSGAIYLALLLYKGKNVLLPNSRWPEYDNSCLVLNKNIVEYNYLKDNEFDLTSIETIFKQFNDNEVMLVINDPAHNPTGYNMSVIEYIALINLLNNYNKMKINVLIDLAYLDFSTLDYKKEILPLFNNLKEHVNLYLAFSGSKSFGVYGLRMGALINLTKDLELANTFKKETYKITGAMHGAPNSLSVLLLNDLMKNETIFAEQKAASKILKNRANLLIAELNKVQLEYFSYKSGFFLTIKDNDPVKTANLLKTKNVYVVPTYNGLRIALSAIKEEEIKRLVKIIKQNR